MSKNLAEKLTKYERARIIGARALQIAMGAPLLLTISPEDLGKIKYSTIEVAKKEFLEGVLPITIKRPLPQKIEI
ncbi:MAG: DNA-directed RNA polymerase subunit K [Candidatus Woesearchaeota archaeon]|nr:MAG: DNA-directed RNA polymerase subunit K [Candidatus Woesearchaeota archaeon]